MTEIDRDILLELLNKCSTEELQKELDIYKEIFEYIKETKKSYTINANPRNFLYNEENNTQIFTNQRTSIFCLNDKIFDFDKIKLNQKISSNQIELAKQEEINKYFDTSKRYFGDSWYSSVSLVNSNGLTYYKIFEELTTISLNEYKLIKLLLKNPKIYASCKNSILKVEGENGYAYVLGYKNGGQLIL